MEQKIVDFLNKFSTFDLTADQWEKFINIWDKYNCKENIWPREEAYMPDLIEDGIEFFLKDKFNEIDDYNVYNYHLYEELPKDTNPIIKALWKEAQDDYYSIFPRYEK